MPLEMAALRYDDEMNHVIADHHIISLYEAVIDDCHYGELPRFSELVLLKGLEVFLPYLNALKKKTDLASIAQIAASLRDVVIKRDGGRNYLDSLRELVPEVLSADML